LGRRSECLELFDGIYDRLRRVGDAREEFIGELESPGWVTYCLEAAQGGRREGAGEDMDLVLGIDPSQIGKERGLLRQGPLELPG